MADCVSVHVSGLAPDCDDADIEAQLRKALDRPGTCGMLAVLDAPQCLPLDELLSALDKPDGVDSVQGEEAQEPAASSSCPGQKAQEQAESSSQQSPGEPTEDASPEILSEGAADGSADDTAASAADETAEGATTEAAEEAEDEIEAELLSDSCYSCSVPRKKTGEGKGFCFLEFLTQESADAAVMILNAGVQINGSLISAQIARANASTVTEHYDKKNKEKNKTAKHNKEQAVYLPQMKIKNQGYHRERAPGEPGGPPLRKQGARPIREEKTAKTLMKAFEAKVVNEVAQKTALLSLGDREKQLQLENAKQLALKNGKS
jgi:RNA recognition motif-containing protein